VVEADQGLLIMADEIFRSDFHYQDHTDEFTHKLTQPTEPIILERNNELRKNPGVIRDLGHSSEGGTWGRQLASIPQIVYDRAIRDGFHLNCKNAQQAGLEMARFLKTDIGKACLVQ